MLQPMAGARAWHSAIVVAVLVALVLQVLIALDVAASPPAHLTGTLAGTHLAGRIVRVLSFFTIESNILSGLVSALLALRPARDGRGLRVLRLAALIGITVTGVVYGTVLARVHEPHGWRETTSNALFHYVVPIAMVLGWLLFGPRPRITVATIGWALLWPIAYLAYTLVRGAATHWYPYPFLDVATHGYARVVVNCVGVTAVFAVVAALLLLGDRALPRAPRDERRHYRAVTSTWSDGVE